MYSSGKLSVFLTINSYYMDENQTVESPVEAAPEEIVEAPAEVPAEETVVAPEPEAA